METPVMKNAFVAANATVVGNVMLEENVSVWYGAVLRGDGGPIRIGPETNLQELCVVHEETTVGRGCTVGHGAILHGCTLGDNCLIGMGAIVLDGAVLGDNCLVGAGALVTGKTNAPAGSMLLGSPAKVVKALSDDQIEAQRQSAQHYIELARQQLELK